MNPQCCCLDETIPGIKVKAYNNKDATCNTDFGVFVKGILLLSEISRKNKN
jgi:hypothetical protein